jgi:phosphatidylglycerol:prolipoprotein diacylglycerol transferase
MLPNLKLLPGISLPSYGLMLFISFVVGIYLFHRRVNRQGLLPQKFRYTWFWAASDVLIALVVLGAGLWAILLAPEQWALIRQRPEPIRWLFRLIALALTIYLEYGSVQHIRRQLRAREIAGNEFTTYLAIWVLFSAIAGSRLLYVALHWSEFQNDLVGTFAFWRGGLQGLIFYGGLVGALVMGVLFALANRLSLLRLLDAAMPSILLGEFFTRIGCFLNGCCFGVACDLPWAVAFPQHSPSAGAGLAGMPIHPTQLYSSLAGLVMFGIASFLERRRMRPGVLFGVMMLFYSGFRFGIDFIRYYENPANLWTNQAIALGLGIIGLAVIVRARRRPDRAVTRPSGR